MPQESSESDADVQQILKDFKVVCCPKATKKKAWDFHGDLFLFNGDFMNKNWDMIL